MRNQLIYLSVFISSAVYADNYSGISIGGDTEHTDAEMSVFELNYVGRASRYLSIYGGYGRLNVAQNNDYYSHSNPVTVHGTQAGLLVHPSRSLITPYIGLGIYSGQISYCDRYDRRYCDHDSVFSIYPEAGVQLNIGENLQLTAKARHYEFDQSYLKDELVSMVAFSIYFR